MSDTNADSVISVSNKGTIAVPTPENERKIAIPCFIWERLKRIAGRADGPRGSLSGWYQSLWGFAAAAGLSGVIIGVQLGWGSAVALLHYFAVATAAIAGGACYKLTRREETTMKASIRDVFEEMERIEKMYPPGYIS